jgi:protein gp37
MDEKWVVDIRNQCVGAGVAFFFKQWGGRSPKAGGRLLQGKEWNQFPGLLRPAPKQREIRAVA